MKITACGITQQIYGVSLSIFQTHTLQTHRVKNLGLLFQEMYSLWDPKSLWVTISFNEKRAIPVLPLDFKVTKDIILNWFWVLKPKHRLHPLQNTQVILSIFKTKKVFRSKENTINVISTKQQLVSHMKRAQLIMMVNEIRITSNFQRLIIPVFITYFSK